MKAGCRRGGTRLLACGMEASKPPEETRRTSGRNAARRRGKGNFRR
jgi:hypothetical protein